MFSELYHKPCTKLSEWLVKARSCVVSVFFQEALRIHHISARQTKLWEKQNLIYNKENLVVSLVFDHYHADICWLAGRIQRNDVIELQSIG